MLKILFRHTPFQKNTNTQIDYRYTCRQSGHFFIRLPTKCLQKETFNFQTVTRHGEIMESWGLVWQNTICSWARSIKRIALTVLILLGVNDNWDNWDSPLKVLNKGIHLCKWHFMHFEQWTWHVWLSRACEWRKMSYMSGMIRNIY